MAYSRWGASKWFVFGSSPETVPKNDQYLSIMHCDGAALGFTYQKLKNNLQDCLTEINSEAPSTPQELEELTESIRAFLHEVETGERI